MEEAYLIEEGGWYRLPPQKGRWIYFLLFLLKIFRLSYVLLILFVTFYVTLIVFRKCIKVYDLNNMIALGAVFATFGSAAISIFSLYCNEEITKFQNNITILQGNLINQKFWMRWDFFKRIERKKISLILTQYYIVKNPKITFYISSRQVKVTLPSCMLDFKDILISWNFIKLKYFYSFYYKHIMLNSNEENTNSILVYNCLFNIYKNILCYKFGQLFIWIGSGFIFSSIIFSFWYKEIENIITLISNF